LGRLAQNDILWFHVEINTVGMAKFRKGNRKKKPGEKVWVWVGWFKNVSPFGSAPGKKQERTGDSSAPESGLLEKGREGHKRQMVRPPPPPVKTDRGKNVRRKVPAEAKTQPGRKFDVRAPLKTKTQKKQGQGFQDWVRLCWGASKSLAFRPFGGGDVRKIFFLGKK